MKHPLIKTVPALLLLLAATSARGEQFQEFGDIVIHYNTIQTDFLSAKVANDYGIQRSRNRVMLNVAVQDRARDPSKRSIQADIRASAANLTGQLRKVEMRAVQEGGVTYYIGELGVDNEEVLDFTVQVTPEGSDRTYTVTFREQFFTR